MAATAVDIGWGTTISFASSFLAKVTGVRWTGLAREARETSHMTSTNGWRTYLPTDLKDPGTLETDLLFDKNAATKTNIASAPETVTVTYATPAGGSSGGTWACSGFMLTFDTDIPMDDVMTASSNIKFTGEPTFTDGS